MNERGEIFSNGGIRIWTKHNRQHELAGQSLVCFFVHTPHGHLASERCFAGATFSENSNVPAFSLRDKSQLSGRQFRNDFIVQSNREGDPYGSFFARVRTLEVFAGGR